jgi:hypothetical protein
MTYCLASQTCEQHEKINTKRDLKGQNINRNCLPIMRAIMLETVPDS